MEIKNLVDYYRILTAAGCASKTEALLIDNILLLMSH